jgi:hypothetical protein
MIRRLWWSLRGGLVTNETSLRTHLLELLEGAHAHANLEAAVKGMPPALRGMRPDGVAHSPWELLEHLRIAQHDILEFIRNPAYTSPDFPGGYWPASAEPPGPKAWDESVAALFADRASIRALIEDESLDLFERIPHGTGQTLLREALLVADHNAYHGGQLIQLRRQLGAWT